MSERLPPRVVLVDDYPDLIKAWRRVLMLTCEIVGTGSNGAEALELAAMLDPDVIVVDHFMPGLTGLDVCRQLPGVAPRTRIILTTAADDGTIRSVAARLGVAVVEKSSGALELERAIHRAASEARLPPRA